MYLETHTSKTPMRYKENDMAQVTTLEPEVFDAVDTQKTRTPVSVPNTPMNSKDRCDSTFRPSHLRDSESCQVRAYVRVVLNTGQLVFCSHHYESHKESMGDSIVRVDDHREEPHNRLKD